MEPLTPEGSDCLMPYDPNRSKWDALWGVLLIVGCIAALTATATLIGWLGQPRAADNEGTVCVYSTQSECG